MYMIFQYFYNEIQKLMLETKLIIKYSNLIWWRIATFFSFWLCLHFWIKKRPLLIQTITEKKSLMMNLEFWFYTFRDGLASNPIMQTLYMPWLDEFNCLWIEIMNIWYGNAILLFRTFYVFLIFSSQVSDSLF